MVPSYTIVNFLDVMLLDSDNDNETQNIVYAQKKILFY